MIIQTSQLRVFMFMLSKPETHSVLSTLFQALYLVSLLLFPVHIQAGESNSLSGRIIDKETNEPVSFAYLHLEEIDRTSVADANGYFIINNIPEGSYKLTVHRIGYKTSSREVSVSNEPNTKLTILLTPSLLSSQAIEVTGEGAGTSGSNLEHASRKFLGSDLRRDLGSTLSQTLSNLPGFDQRTMGSAPGRPVIRGLGDERVEILQDGITSGDISAQSSDHAVTIDPVSAQEVEIARGPAALAFGANAIGGVINVVRNQIATSVPSKLNGTFSVNGETVNTGFSSALNFNVPWKDFVITMDLNGRHALNTQTPTGKIDNTFFRTTNDAVGVSWIRNWGYIGGSLGTYLSTYGIPPDPNGHEKGVDIVMSKFQYVGKSEIIINNDFFNTIEADLSLKNYNHKEYEKDSSGSRTGIGTEFGLVSTNLNINLKHKPFGFLEKGRFGISAQTEDYAVNGANTPNSNRYKFGVYIIEETDFGAFHLEGGIRFDAVANTTQEQGLFYGAGVRRGNIDSTFYKNRTFTALSSSVSAIYGLGNGFSLGTTILHSFRAPSLEELYSEGPHLASYSYEIGNPDLDPERGLAKEFFLRYKGSNSVFETTVYHNGFSNYLYARNTGRQNFSQPILNDYQFTGTEAELYGFEVFGEQQIMNAFVLDASISYTIGRRDSSGINRPLPQIPPLKFKTSVKYVNNNFEIGSRLRIAGDQSRTGEFETPTEGYTLVDVFSQYRFSKGPLLHTISLNVNNLFNETWYNHLSRIKELRPEAGVNISVLYRVFF